MVYLAEEVEIESYMVENFHCCLLKSSVQAEQVCQILNLKVEGKITMKNLF